MAVYLGSPEFDKALASSQQLCQGFGLTFLHDSPPCFSLGRVSLLDFSGERPLLINHGAASVDDIDKHMQRWNLGTVVCQGQ